MTLVRHFLCIQDDLKLARVAIRVYWAIGNALPFWTLEEIYILNYFPVKMDDCCFSY